MIASFLNSLWLSLSSFFSVSLRIIFLGLNVDALTAGEDLDGGADSELVLSLDFLEMLFDDKILIGLELPPAWLTLLGRNLVGVLKILSIRDSYECWPFLLP